MFLWSSQKEASELTHGTSYATPLGAAGSLRTCTNTHTQTRRRSISINRSCSSYWVEILYFLTLPLSSNIGSHDISSPILCKYLRQWEFMLRKNLPMEGCFQSQHHLVPVSPNTVMLDSSLLKIWFLERNTVFQSSRELTKLKSTGTFDLVTNFFQSSKALCFPTKYAKKWADTEIWPEIAKTFVCQVTLSQRGLTYAWQWDSTNLKCVLVMGSFNFNNMIICNYSSCYLYMDTFERNFLLKDFNALSTLNS